MINNMVFRKDFILPNFLMLPMVSHWLLPSSIESAMYIRLDSMAFYMPNLFYLIYVSLYYKLNIIKPVGYRNKSLAINILCLILFVYSLLNTASNGLSYVKDIIFNNLNLIYFSILFVNFPLDKFCLDKTKYIIIITLFIICLEVILFGLGILHYTAATGEDIAGSEFGGIMRVSTTVASATGTGLIIIILGAISMCFYDLNKRFKFFLYSLVTLSVFYTMSRGSILTWCLFSFVYFYINYYLGLGIKKKVSALFMLFVFVFVLFNIGAIDPIIQRSNEKNSLDEISSGRGDLYEDGMRIYRMSLAYGVGVGQVFPDKSNSLNIQSKYFARPHNFYIITLAENGLIGFILTLFLLILFILNMKYDNPLFWFYLFLLIFNYNTEGVWGQAEYASVVQYLVMILLLDKFPIKKYQPNICGSYK